MTGVLPNTIAKRSPDIHGNIQLGVPNRLTNVLESGGTRGLRLMTKRAKTLHESQRRDQCVEVEHMRNNHSERH